MNFSYWSYHQKCITKSLQFEAIEKVSNDTEERFIRRLLIKLVHFPNFLLDYIAKCALESQWRCQIKSFTKSLPSKRPNSLRTSFHGSSTRDSSWTIGNETFTNFLFPSRILDDLNARTFAGSPLTSHNSKTHAHQNQRFILYFIVNYKEMVSKK